MPGVILIIDDEPNVCWSLREFLQDEGYTVYTAASVEEGEPVLVAKRPDVLLLDVILPGQSGLEFLESLQQRRAPVTTIVMTAHGSMNTAIEAVRKGAYEYLTKPFDLHKVKLVIERALQSRKLREEVVSLREQLSQPARLEDLMVGRSPAMQEVYKRIGAVADADASVLIQGESGSGKEVTARAIHCHGPRREGPFVPLNCGALPESLLESELFGHEKGAFTGAAQARIGKLEKAGGGTIFLDEIGDIPPAVQVALLRFLEERTIERVGGSEVIRLNARVIAASHRDIAQLVKEGAFREDLYYRLNVVTIHLPPLRERREDIPLLIEHFLRHGSYPHAEISATAMEILQKHAWPGNVRELRNAMDHALVLGRGAVVLPEHLPSYLTQRPDAAATGPQRVLEAYLRELLDQGKARFGEEVFDRVMEVWEEPLIRHVIQRFNGNQVRASEFLGIHRTTFRTKLKKYNLDA